MSINELDLDCLYLADSNKKKSHLEPEISKCDFFLAEHGGKRAASASPKRDTRHRPPRRPAFIKTQAGSPSISVPHISQH